LLIGNDDIDFREQVLKTLIELGKDQKSLQVLKDEKSKLNERVEERLKSLRSLTAKEDREQAEDEINLLQILFQRLKSTTPPPTSPTSSPPPKPTTSTNSISQNSIQNNTNNPIPNGTTGQQHPKKR